MAPMARATFLLPPDLMRRVRAAVAVGAYPSQSALAREALARELDRTREERLRCEFVEAARDPLFLQDICETQPAFASADVETARMVQDG